ncbi:MAG: M3 family oligoendopeptidase [Bacillota bacterium]
MFKNLNPKWDLDSYFPGGSDSPELAAYLETLEKDIRALSAHVQSLPGDPAQVSFWTNLLDRIQDVSVRMRHAGSFIGCLAAQNDQDRKAIIIGGRSRQLGAALASVLTKLDEFILKVPDADWSRLMEAPELSPIAFNLNERRQRAKDKLPAEQEMLINSLSVDGYHAWGNVYNTAVSKVRIPFERDGKSVVLSAGQASNLMADPDRSVRADLFAKWEKAWTEVEDFCATALNHLAGYRLSVYRARGWEDVLREPLEMNRMSRETLEVMWDTIDRNKERVVAYLQRKKKLLGVHKLSWHDVSAPVGGTGRKVSYDEAANFIVEQVAPFSPRMAELVTRAFKERWVEAEDRPHKRPGAFCSSSPVMKQSRVFMTFSGTVNNVATLAHELGHAYHQSVMNDLPPLAQQYAMNVAETASTFSEMVVADAALRSAKTTEEKVSLMEDKLARSVALLMNIHCRFLFETRFYEERKKGMVSADRLSQLMLEAQKEAFCDTLDEYHPRFWASKLHFYNTGVPFYNFPYTFGYLFSAGVYALAMEEGAAFEEKYVALLRDTGRMLVEDLASKHLGVDLKQPEFWQKAIDVAIADLDEFLELTK